MRVAKRSSPGSYRRMRIPNASPSPPKTRATTSTSGAPSFTMKVTPTPRGSSRYLQRFARGRQEGRRADARAAAATAHGSGERLECRTRTAPVGRVAGHTREIRQDERNLRIRAREHVVEDVLGPIAGGRRCRPRGDRRCGGEIVVAAERVGVATLDEADDVDRYFQVMPVVTEVIGGKAGGGDLHLVLQQTERRRAGNRVP